MLIEEPFIWLMDDEIWSKVLVGGELEEIRLKVGVGVAGWVAESGEILNIKRRNSR